MAQTCPQVVPADFQPFFTASVAASAALIGLLFVSISIAGHPCRSAEIAAIARGRSIPVIEDAAHSLTAHIGEAPVGTHADITCFLLLPMWRADHTLRRGLFLFLISFGIYGFEISIGIQLWLGSSSTGAMTALLELLLGAYAIGLGRAWELLGARRLGWTGWIGLFGDALRRARQSRPSRQEPPRGKT